MRLLTWNDRGEPRLTADLHGQNIPPYAILSHTWGDDDDEVSFTDLQRGPGQYRNKDGYEKLRICGERARRDGLDHFWVDTCCIDKANYTELSEAITSMFRWYARAVKCYAYLSDVSADPASDVGDERLTWRSKLQSSRWFTRGWTLQELLAPSVVEFLTREGDYIGDRKTLDQEIHKITAIPLAALGGAPLDQYPFPERLGWTHGRETKRVEDMAYCLMGICGVSISIRYGEGKIALHRLEEQVNKLTGQSGTVLRRLEEQVDKLTGQNGTVNVYIDTGMQPSPRPQITNTQLQGFRSHSSIRASSHASTKHLLPTTSASSRTATTEPCDTSDASNFPHAYGPLEIRDAGHEGNDTDLRTVRSHDGMDGDGYLHALAFEQSHSWKRDIGENTKGTCDWLVESSEYKTWMQENGLFLILGHPGCGKSTLMKYALTEQLSRDVQILAISFFFYRSGIDLQRSMQGMFRALLHQLLEKDTESRPVFYKLCRDTFGARAPSGTFEWNQQDLQTIFKKLVADCAARRAVKIFIDAVDECEAQDHEDLFRFFHSLRGSYQGGAARIGTLMTTRIQLSSQIVHDFRVYVEDRNQDAIRQYVDKEMRLSDGAELARDALKSLLQEHANGSFLWLVLVLRRVHHLNWKGENLRTIMDEVKQCPRGLDELYEGLVGEIDETDIAKTGMLFQWICFAARPMSTAELRIALTIHATGMQTSIESYLDEANPSHIVNDQQLRRRINHLSNGLVAFSSTAPEDGETVVQFYHETFREFMLTKGLQIISRKAGNTDLFTETADAQLANVCLWFLSCDEIVVAMSDGNLDDLARHAFFKYAGDHWFSHASQAEKKGMESRVGWPSPATLSAWIHAGQTMGNQMSSHFVAGSKPLHVAARYGLVSLVRRLIGGGGSTDKAHVSKTNTKFERKVQAPGSPSNITSRSRTPTRKLIVPANVQSTPPRTRYEGRERSNMKRLLHNTPTTTERDAIKRGSRMRTQLPTPKATVSGANNQELCDTQKRRPNATDVRDTEGSTPLWLAAGAGQLDAIILLHDEGAEVSLQGEKDSTPLYMASRNGYLKVVEYLFEHGADVRTPNKHGWTPLNSACSSGHLEVVKYLLERGADIHTTTKSNQTPLYSASTNGHLEVVEYLFEHGADADVHTLYDGSWTPLNAASNNGHLEVVKCLFKHGANIHTPNKNGWTPLNSASNKGHVEVVQCLIERGADVHTSNENGWTPLNSASGSGHLKVVKFLLEHGADIHTATKSNQTPLYSASHDGHLEVVKYLFEHGADVDVHTPYDSSWTPLNVTSNYGHAEVVKCLIEHGANIHTPNKNGWTPLNSASNNGHLEVVRCLIERGADVHTPNKNGWTPLNSASNNGHLEVVKCLLDHGADVDIHTSNKGGWTPLNAASDSDHPNVVRLLLEHGADIDIHTPTKNGWTPLDWAMHRNNPEVAQLLLSAVVDVNVRGHHGQTPLVRSIIRACKETSRSLVRSGAEFTLTDNYGRTAVDWLKLLKTDNELLNISGSDFETPPETNIARLDDSIATLSAEIIGQQIEDSSSLFNDLGHYLLVRNDTEHAYVAFQQKIETSTQKSSIQHDMQCDLCSVYPIEGSRFVCKICPDTDLCQSCMGKYHEGKHFAACSMHEYFEVSESDSTLSDSDSRRKWLQDIVDRYARS